VDEKPGPAGAPQPNLSPEQQQARIEANLAQLSPEDRKQVEEQQYCPLMKDVRLGARGVPIKVTVEGQTVFVCCRGCQRQAGKEPGKVVEGLKELKETKAASGKP
jgi:hypothetical protein